MIASAKDDVGQDEEGEYAALLGVGLIAAVRTAALGCHADEGDDDEGDGRKEE